MLSRLLLIGGHEGMPHMATVVATSVALIWGAMAACRGRVIREVAVASLTLAWLAGAAPWSGHPVELAIPVLWMAAMSLHGRSRPAAALLLGAAVLIAPIAVLGFPCLLAVTGLLRAARTGMVAAGVAVLGYLPFVVSGRFEMFEHVWPVAPETLPYLLGLREVTWAARLGQAVIVAGGCALVAHLLRGRRVAVAAAPAAAALLRVATDPLTSVYYWVPAAVCTVLVVALLPEELPVWRQALVVVSGYVAAMAATTDQGALGAAVCLGAYLVAWKLPGRTGRSGRLVAQAGR